MKCKVDGCEKPVHFKLDQLCQMHYFRRMRYGTFELTRKPGREQYVRSDGYVMIHRRGHRFASKKNHYAFEHRVVAYEKYGDTLPDCELCGIPLDWSVAVIDHIDEVKTNNDPSNLRPLCNLCNISRTERLGISYPGAVPIDYEGRTMTATEWSREPGVNVHGATILRRLREGATPEQAIYGKKITHNGNRPPKRPPPAPKTSRSNAVNIEIDGVLKTTAEWSRDPRCEVSDATLRNRVKDGHSHTLTILKRASGYENRKY